MTCPACSSSARVIDSRADDGDGSVRRRRYQCWKCDARFSTYEIPADRYEKVQAMVVNAAQIDATIATLRAIKEQFGATNGKG